MPPRALNDLIVQQFSMEELGRLAREVGVNIDSLPPGGIEFRALELVRLLERRGAIVHLLAAFKRMRPMENLDSQIPLLIRHYFNADEMIALCNALPNVDCAQLGFDRKGLRLLYTSTDDFYIRDVKQKQSRALYQAMADNGRLGELAQAIAKAKPDLDLSWSDAIYEETAVDTGSASAAGSGSAEPSATAYENFDIRIGIKQGDEQYPVTAESVYGELGSAVLQTLPNDDYLLEDLIAYLRDGVAKDTDAEELGKLLRQFLFPPPVWNLYGRSLAKAQADGKEGLRVRLRIDRNAPELSGIPWEYCQDDRSFLALNEASPMIRYIPTERPPEAMSTPEKVKILVVMAGPDGYEPLNVEQEVARMHEALGGLIEAKRVEMKIIKRADRRKLRRNFRSFDPHVLHFIGHGVIKENNEGALVLEGPDKKPQLVDAEDMRILLQSSGVKLVVLSACDTAKQAASEAIMGVAPGLVSIGVPAVVAMQFKVPDKTAVAFTHDLYDFLAQGRPLDSAVTEARIGSYFDYDDKVFWAIPVLFMRSPDGVLWQ